MGTKGSRVTTYISLPVRFLVLMPTSDHVGVSRRIEGDAERTRLRDLVTRLRRDEHGLHRPHRRRGRRGVEDPLRNGSSCGISGRRSRKNSRGRPAPIPAPPGADRQPPGGLRDLLLNDAERVVIDSRKGYDAIRSFLDTFMPSLKDSVTLYEGSEPIFDAYNLEGDISRRL